MRCPAFSVVLFQLGVHRREMPPFVVEFGRVQPVFGLGTIKTHFELGGKHGIVDPVGPLYHVHLLPK